MPDAYVWSPPAQDALLRGVDAAEHSLAFMIALTKRVRELEEDLACQTGRAEAAEQEVAEQADRITDLEQQVARWRAHRVVTR